MKENRSSNKIATGVALDVGSRRILDKKRITRDSVPLIGRL